MNAGQRVCAPLRQQPVVGEVARLVDVFAVLAVLGVDGVGGHQDGRLWRTVVLVVQDGLLHLGKKTMQRFPFLRTSEQLWSSSFVKHSKQQKVGQKLSFRLVLCVHLHQV